MPFKSRTLPVLLLLAGLAAPAAADTRITIDDPGLYDLRYEGFVLPRAAEVRIEAVGLWRREAGHWAHQLFGAGETPMSVHAWILDADTRDAVWEMDPRETERVDGSLRRVEQALTLPAGRYEVYLFSGNRRAQRAVERRSDQPEQPRDESLWDRLWRGVARTPEDVQREVGACYVAVTFGGVSRGELQRFEPTGVLPDALIAHNRLPDSKLAVTGFALARPSSLRLYGVIEATREGTPAADFGWIVDAATREVVWSPRARSLEAAGGAQKNRRIDEAIELPAGRYLLYTGTDDSHSLQEFNGDSPRDPLNWGLTLRPGAGFDPSGFEVFPVATRSPLIEATALGDGQFFRQPFRLRDDQPLWIQALGEYSERDGQFVDYAWVVETQSGRTVWEMTATNTMAAGGGAKNRRFDGVVDLPAGDYILYYVSDDSHAFETWNAAAPFEPQAWGVRVEAPPAVEARNFQLLRQVDEPAGGYLVRIQHVGNDQRQRRAFTVETGSNLRIRALGEGDDGEMYDYGYIANTKSGEVVWRMDPRDSDHAGGADKNRSVDEVVFFEPGSYEAIYVTDDSHAFGAWNAGRPNDPLAWGMTVRIE